MSLLEAFVLALVQGVTEFLPISSSAHLVLLPWLIGWEEHGLLFDVVTNTGTLLAAVAYFRQDLLQIARQHFNGRRVEGRQEVPRRLAAKLAVATLPAVACALLFYSFLSGAARQPLLIAATSTGFGLLLWWADRRGRRQRRLADLGWLDACLIGCAQALALIPGTSRSGVTMTVGLWRGFERAEAARFSFLLAIPVGLLALAEQILEVLLGFSGEVEVLPLAVGFVVSAISAYFAIGALLRWLERQSMTPFVIYRLLLGGLISFVVCCI